MKIVLRRPIGCRRCGGTTRARLLQAGFVEDLQAAFLAEVGEGDLVEVDDEDLEDDEDLDEAALVGADAGPQGAVTCNTPTLFGELGCGWSRWVWSHECIEVP